MSTRHPSPGLFVAQLDSRAGRRTLEDRAAELATVETLTGSNDLFLLRVREPASSPRETWQQLHEALGDVAVSPAIVDDRGALSYPTGRLAVRFKAAPSPRQLEEFAEQMDLLLVSTNKFVSSQAVFAPRRRGGYLPDVVERVETDGRVQRAWPEALAMFTRDV
jgi:hypothetical protein